MNRKPALALKIGAVALLLLACGLLNSGYSVDFNSSDDWVLEAGTPFSGSVQNGVFRFVVDDTDSLFWTVAGENYAHGVYELDVKQTAGPEDAAYGLMYGVSADGDSFHIFEVSTDGFIWAGRCDNRCEEIDMVLGEGWIESTDVREGLNQLHQLKVDVATDGTMIFSVNGVEVGRGSDPAFTGGDLGMLVETFNGPGQVVVEFDNLKFSPPEG